MFYNLIIPLGIVTISLLLISALLGMRVIELQTKIRLKLHKILAVTTVILALFHASLVIYYKFFF